MGSHTMSIGFFMVTFGLLWSSSAESYPWRVQDGPPPGPSNKAICPVTGMDLTITDGTVSLKFKNGQKLYFVSQDAMEGYRTNPRAFLLSPFEAPLPMPDGARGLPDLRGSTLYCPFSNETINVDMKSMRVDHRHGQAVYFCCHGCFTRFWADPQSSFDEVPTELRTLETQKDDELMMESSSAESYPWRVKDGPPPGPSNKAICPVTGKNLTITDATASLVFKNGQKLYFSSKEASQAYRTTPRAFLLSPFELPLPMPDGARGLPDLRGSVLYCPYSNETIDVGMKSIRVDHRYGQAVYFCCHGCFTRFWSDPKTSFAEENAMLV